MKTEESSHQGNLQRQIYCFNYGGMRRTLLMCAKPENVCAYIKDYIDNHYSGLWAIVE